MRIAVSASGSTLDAEVAPRFGRCRYFIIVDPETMQYEAIENSSALASGGAGISAAQMIVGKEVKAVLTGNCGPNAFQVLSAAGIQVITGVSGNLKAAIENYRSGRLQAIPEANVPDHFGMGSIGSSPGMGRGMGGGVARGRGRGKGFGGPGMTSPASQVAQPQTPQQEIEALKIQSQALSQQLTDIQQRIEQLEKTKR